MHTCRGLTWHHSQLLLMISALRRASAALDPSWMWKGEEEESSGGVWREQSCEQRRRELRQRERYSRTYLAGLVMLSRRYHAR